MIPKIVVTVALMAAQVALQMTQRIKGPRLDSLKTTTADYGTPINRFWGKRSFECPVFWAADLHETKHTSKTKGGKNTQYKYFADFAVMIADHQIDGVTKVYMDEKLVYQMTDVGPVSIGAAADLKLDQNMRIYLGTEDQEADPLMEAWCDDRYGVNSCPAYRGTSYLVFDHLPVNNFGNRIPNVKVEAVSDAAASHPYEQEGTTQSYTAMMARSGTWIIAAANGTAGSIDWYDAPTRQLLGTTSGSDAFAATVYNVTMTKDGTAYFTGLWTDGHDLFGALYEVAPLGAVIKHDAASSGINRAFDVGGAKVYTALFGSAGAYLDFGALISGLSYGNCVNFCIDSEDQVYGLFLDASAATFEIAPIPMGTAISATGTVSRGSSGLSGAICYVESEDHFVVAADGRLYGVNRLGALTFNVAFTGSTLNFPYNDPKATSFWSGFSEISLVDGSTIRSVISSAWLSEDTVGGNIYDPINNAIWSHPQFIGHYTIRYLDRIGSSGVTLQNIVDTVAGWCGLSGQDTSALTQTVLGYSVTQGTGKDMIGPLLDIHDVDCRPHDFVVQFVNRGSGPSGSTILTGDFVRDGDTRYTVTIQQDTDLPRKLTFNFADYDHEQQPNNAIAQRPLDAIDTTREETVDLSSYATQADIAQPLADRYLRRLWNSRERTKNSLTAQYLALEPGDVRTISLDGSTRPVRLDKLTITPTSISCEWVRDEASVAILNNATGAGMDGNDVQTIFIPGPTKGFILDAPLIRDADNDVNPVIYYAAGSYGSGWIGADVYQGEDGTYDTLFGSLDSTGNATWGYATSTLSAAVANLWDRGNSLTVQVFGTLTSHTEAELDADTTLNLIALGDTGRWEYLQFGTATLTGTSGVANLYTLSDLKRGRRGTEINVANHETGDQLILMSAAVPAKMGTDDIGDDLSFKVQSLGRDPDDAPAIDLTYEAETLMPYAPARIKWTTDGTDMFGEIIRRSRTSSGWLDSGVVDLGENSEAYEIDIYHSTTLKRTISVTGTNLFTYTGAQIAADGNTVGVPPPLNAYEMSEKVGRGFALAA